MRDSFVGASVEEEDGPKDSQPDQVSKFKSKIEDVIITGEHKIGDNISGIVMDGT